MNRVVLLGGIVSLLILLFIFIDEPEISDVEVIEKKSQLANHKLRETAHTTINYHMTEKKIEKKEEKKIVEKQKKDDVNKNVLYETYDTERKYRIVLVKSDDVKIPVPRKNLSIKGKIGSSNYTLGVPDTLIGSSSYAKVKIYDIENGSVVEFVPSFIDDLDVKKQMPQVDIDPWSGSYDNKLQKNSILPFPGDPVLPGSRV